MKLHLDGARVFNAAVAQNVEVNAITHHFDSVSVCLSKGLGAPVGSVLCGSVEFIARARRWRKVAGGGMRQAGILAAAGLYALNHHVERLAEDHANARLLAHGLGELPQLNVRYEATQTNMVFVSVPEKDVAHLTGKLQAEGIVITPGAQLRLVTHLDVTTADVEQVVRVFHDYYRQV